MSYCDKCDNFDDSHIEGLEDHQIKKKEHFIVLIMINKVPRYTVQLRLSDQILRIDVGSGIKDIANKELSRDEREFVELAFNHAFNLRTKQLEESK